MSVDVYMKVEKVKGESTDAKHKDWFELLSFNIGVSQPVTGISAAGGLTAGKADFQDFCAVKTLDSATPILSIFCAGGEHIPKVEVDLCTVIKGKQHVFMKYILEKCLLTSVTASGTNGDDRPLENLCIAYSKITWKYSPFDNDGATGGSTDRTWNLGSHE